jgi:hypothetical protein
MGRRPILSAWLMASAALAAPAFAQEQPRPAALSAPLAATERARLTARVIGDARVRALVGAQPRTIVSDPVPDKNEADRFTYDSNAPVPSRRIVVTLFDPRTNRAARAQVGAEGRIISVQRIAANNVPFTADDASDALAIARASDTAQRAIPNLAEFRLHVSGTPLSPTENVAQFLPVRSVAPKDPCAADRCGDLVFRTPAGYLSVRAHVDLTRRTVSVEGARR